MVIDPITSGSRPLHLVPPLADPRPTPSTSQRPAGTPDHRPAPDAPRARELKVQVTFHDDLRMLVTRLVDDRTGDVVSEYPPEQVLDVVADLIARIRSREES